MQIDRRIALAGNEPYLLAERQTLRLRPKRQLAVLVRDAGDLDIIQPVHPWRAFFGAVGFQAGIDDGAFGGRRADHRGEHEQAVLERRIEPAIFVADAGVLGVHEHV